jgi:hypothetical protein
MPDEGIVERLAGHEQPGDLTAVITSAALSGHLR